MSTPGSALFPRARAANACVAPENPFGGDMEILNKRSYSGGPTAAPQKDRGQIHPTRPMVETIVCSPTRRKLWRHAFLRELSSSPSFLHMPSLPST